MHVRSALGTLVAGSILIGLAWLTLSPFATLSPTDYLDRYLRAAAGAEADRGWDYLHSATREIAYANDQARYLADAEAADWSALRWSPPTVAFTDDGIAQVEVRLLSPPSLVPSFLITSGVLSGRCAGTQPIGLAGGVIGGLFADGRLGGNALSGYQMACNERFMDVAPNPH